MNAYILTICTLIAIYGILGASLNLALGYAGLVNLGHIAFFAIGAYTSALLVKAGTPFLVALAAAGLLAALFGVFLVFVTRKLKGDYFALATLGFSFVIGSILLNWTWLTRGPLGIPGIPRPVVFGFAVKTPMAFFIFCTIICAIAYFILYRLVHSRYGLALEALRDDPIGLSVLGKNIFRKKAEVMAISAFFAGIAGSLFAHYLSYIDPSSFSLSEIILVLSIVIVGGIASLRGSFLATTVLIVLPELLRFIDIPSSVLGPVRQILYGAILLAVLFIRPKGFLGKVDLA